jgi:hypothetical protein
VLSGLTNCWRTLQARVSWSGSDTVRRRRVFNSIFEQNAWGDCESVSGPGSNRARASLFRADLEALVRSLKVRTLLDVPCGDFNWLCEFGLGIERYVGVDIVPALIARNRIKYGCKRRRFLVRDMVSDRLPRADMIFCRDGLVHLSHAEIFATLRNFKRSGSTWLLTNTFVNRTMNQELPGWHPLNLQAPPFALPPPRHVIDERCLGYDGAYRDKRLALWRLSELRIQP